MILAMADNIFYFYNKRNERDVYRENGYSITEEVGDTKVVYASLINQLKD
jgi:hypothetical protein